MYDRVPEFYGYTAELRQVTDLGDAERAAEVRAQLARVRQDLIGQAQDLDDAASAADAAGQSGIADLRRAERAALVARLPAGLFTTTVDTTPTETAVRSRTRTTKEP